MSLLARYGPCIGLTIFHWGRRKVELWWAPSDYSPPPHSHKNSSTEFTILWAKNRRIWRRVGDRVDTYTANTPGVWGKFLSVRAGVVHAFEKGDSCMIWLAFETWQRDAKVTSVAEDFHLA
jgi:hypothetical protein